MSDDDKPTIIDLNSPTFIEELLAHFQRNVKKAREENLRIIGNADGVVDSDNK